LDIQSKSAIHIGIAAVVGGGLAYATFSFIRKKLNDIPPKK